MKPAPWSNCDRLGNFTATINHLPPMAAGFFEVINGEVFLTSLDGVSLGHKPLKPAEDAARMLRERDRAGRGGFSRPLERNGIDPRTIV